MSKQTRADKDEIQRNRDEAYQGGWGDGYAEGYGRAVAEARVAVRVKPLVWGLPLGGFHTAHLPFYGKIEIMRDEVRGVETFILYRATPHRRHYPTLEAAQAAAQADYEARITAALETGAGDE